MRTSYTKTAAPAKNDDDILPFGPEWDKIPLFRIQESNGFMCRIGFALLAGWLAALTGCGGEIYTGDSKPVAAVVTDKRLWKASGTIPDAGKAIDGDMGTAALSRNSYDNAYITIDLSKPCLFNLVIIDQGPSQQYGFPRRVAVLTSMDGQNFIYRYAAPGTRRVTLLYLPSPVLARYVRLQAIVQGDQPWSLGEIYLQ